MPAKALLLLSGEPPPKECLTERPALVVAVDGGGDLCALWGVRPDVLVGDMDSIQPATLARFEAAGVEVVRHPRAKLHTDAQLALDLALDRGAREIVLAGASGRRLDQTVANLGLVLRAAQRGARVRAWEASGRLWSVAPGAPFVADLAQGAVFSVLALTPEVEVSIRGARFPLDRARMAFGDPYGVSNEGMGAATTVEAHAGVAVVIVPSTQYP